MSTPHLPDHKSADFATPRPSLAAKTTLNKEDFVRRWGFASFLELFEASQPAGKAGGKKKWLLTILRGGTCLLWNEGAMEESREFGSREDALTNVPQES